MGINLDKNYSEISPRLKLVRLARELTQRQFAESLGITQGFLSEIERGNKSPSDTLLIAFCKLYGVREEWLFSGSGEMFGVSPMVAEEEAGWRAMTPLLRGIPSGFPQDVPQDFIIDQLMIPDLPAGCFALRASGDFMAPTIRDNDLVFFRPGSEAQHGDVVLVNNLWGEPILRRYRLKNGQEFYSPDNHMYAPFKRDPGTAVIGKVVAVWRRISL